MNRTRNLLCIVPPYFTSGAPPLGPAALLAYLRANGHDDWKFLDLRLWVPNAYAPTYRATGVFGETYIMDVPDLPLVLDILHNFGSGADPLPDFEDNFHNYCFERGINAGSLAEYLTGIYRFVTAALDELPDLAFVGFSLWSSNYLTTLIAAAHLKRRKNPPFIVFGGPQTTESKASAQLALRSGIADVIAIGEGEETLLHLFETFSRSQGPSADVLPGTMRYNQATGEFESARRPLLRMSRLPLPAFDKLPLISYQRRNTSIRTLTYELSRGCTDKCVFCSEWVFWERIRNDDIAHVVDNIARLKHDYGTESIWFMDSLLNATPHRLQVLGEEMLRRNLGLKWGGYLRANVDRDTAALLKRAGFEFTFVGVESLSDETLAQMNKRRTGDDNLDALESLLGAGIDRVVAGFIPGFPGDTRNRFVETASMLADIQHRYPGRFRVNVEPFILSPNQPMYRNMADFGLKPIGWADRYLDTAQEYADITSDTFCSVEGPNQGLDRLGELRVAQAVNLTVSDRPDPFLYYEGEEVSTSHFDLAEMTDGWYMGLMKTDNALIYGLIVSGAERRSYEQLLKDDTAASGFGYGRRSDSSFFGREPFDSYLRSIEIRHLIPPERDNPRIRMGFYRDRQPQPSDIIMLSPFVVARTVESDCGPVILVLDAVGARWHTVDVQWEWIFRELGRGEARIRIPAESESSATATEIRRLCDLGVLWTRWPAADSSDALSDSTISTVRRP